MAHLGTKNLLETKDLQTTESNLQMLILKRPQEKMEPQGMQSDQRALQNHLDIQFTQMKTLRIQMVIAYPQMTTVSQTNIIHPHPQPNQVEETVEMADQTLQTHPPLSHLLLKEELALKEKNVSDHAISSTRD
jgi:hypothetical protein